MNAAQCSHLRPTFGCDYCISTQRQAWARAMFAAWKKKFRAPKCPSCGLKMQAYDHELSPKGLIALVACPNFNDEGYSPCADEDFEVHIDGGK